MDVHLTGERMLVLADQFNMDHAEGRASHKRVDAFGTLAKVAGLLSRPKPEEFELVYKEHRLQPFWRVACKAVFAYQRKRDHVIKLAPEVRDVTIANTHFPLTNHQIALQLVEDCREDITRDLCFDALSGQVVGDLASRLKFAAETVDDAKLAEIARNGTVVVPPTATASVVLRQVLSGLMNKIEADKVTEEAVTFEAIDLYYRPIYAFRYRRQGKEAVVEFDGLTGETRTGGATFESYLGKMLDTRFLLDAGAEAANLILPGATLMKVFVTKGLEMRKKL